MLAIAPNFTPGLVSTAGSHGFIGDIGIAPMHGTPVPYTNKVLMIDRTDVGPSKLFLPDGSYAYAGEYDLDSNTIRAITVPSNTWCSAGAYLPDGTIINNGGGDGTGGLGGNSGIRSFHDGGNLEQVSNTRTARWYPSAQSLPDGRVLVVGGQDIIDGSYVNEASYEFFPADGQDPHQLPFLSRDDVDPAHLYPFMHLIPDGRLFIFAARSSILLDYNSGATTDLPEFQGNLRQYPYTGGSIMLPLDYLDGYRTRVMICGGGNAQKRSVAASESCGIIDLSSNNPSWSMNKTPSPRVMGYLVFLLDGTCLYIGGGTDGFEGYGSSNTPAYRPSIYDPTYDTWQDVQSTGSQPRLYHSAVYLLPDGRIMIQGGNPRPDYNFNPDEAGVDVTQTSLEAFKPWYYDSPNRPSISALDGGGGLGGTFSVTISVPGGGNVDPTLARVALINPGFSTHTVTMNQRYVRLEIDAADGNTLTVRLPTNGNILPPGPYLCTVLYMGIPSGARWFTVTG